MKGKFLQIIVPVAACILWGNLQAQALEEIIVEASPLEKVAKGEAASPAPGYYRVTLSSRVSYADLDLTQPDAAATLERRIKAAATEVCDGIGKAYPDSGPDTKECARRAADKAMVEAAKKIAAARAK